jgi:hypothetical protein
MIFFGSRGRTLNGQHIEGLNCPECGNDQHVTFGAHRYFHVYWIPMFPFSKSAGVQCLKCKNALTDKELPGEIGKELKSTIFTPKRMLPMFAGLILLAIVAAGGFVSVQADNRNEAAFVQNPMVNDIYLVNFAELWDEADQTYKYGIMKVEAISGNEIELLVSTIGYNKKYGPRDDIRNLKANSREYYADQTIVLNHEELQQWKSMGTIYSIERP